MFSTERLILRATRPSDDEDMLKLYNDERVAPWITEGYLVPKQPGYMEKIRTFVDSALLFVVLEEKETGAFVGATGFVHQPEPKNRNAVIFIALAQAHWSKGYGFEAMNFLIDYAFHAMNQHRVSLTVFEGNDRAIDLYRRL
ncbi:hypothetical protein NLJ89_g7401 [Agrocybe chaxingu]|uniref:N-acetyltransferase domain-containing protein n=1 Tax=Agrocybe chaxingu TaxID=84603 RepID=A0A9W8MV38_9AGAR|nr:hypothetical protein NLJ89_g7401 [Agrocybe chaxingu]